MTSVRHLEVVVRSGGGGGDMLCPGRCRSCAVGAGGTRGPGRRVLHPGANEGRSMCAENVLQVVLC